MKESILELRKLGKTYKEIHEILGCSKSTISYHLNEFSKEKVKNRNINNENRIIVKKISQFKTNTVRLATQGFGRSTNRRNKSSVTFSYKAVIDLYGVDTICYLTGRPINLLNDKYHFDHKIPLSKGGSNDLENLGITCREANLAKSDLTFDEFIELCKEVLFYNGYKIEKK